MRIGFVTQWFPPEPGTHLAASIADGLADRGHDVHVLTGFPNYPSGRLDPAYPLRPYRRERPREGMTIHRAPLYPSHDTSAAGRMANYSSFAAASSVVGWLRVPEPDVWLTYSSPATSGLAALTHRITGRAPHCLLLQDLWPDSVTDSGMLGGLVRTLIKPSLSAFSQLSYRLADTIGVISPSMRGVLVARGIDPQHIYDTPNWSSDSLLLPEVPPSSQLRADLGLPQGRLFMYVGNLGHLQALDELVRAFGEVGDLAHLVLIGDGVRRAALTQQVEEGGLTNVHILGPRPATQVGRFIAASDVQVVSLQDTPLLRATTPSKFQFALASGRPVLAHAAGDVADLVTALGLGAAAPPGDLPGVIGAVADLANRSHAELRSMGAAARATYDDRFTEEAGLDRLENMLQHAVHRSSRPQHATLRETS